MKQFILFFLLFPLFLTAQVDTMPPLPDMAGESTKTLLYKAYKTIQEGMTDDNKVIEAYLQDPERGDVWLFVDTQHIFMVWQAEGFPIIFLKERWNTLVKTKADFMFSHSYTMGRDTLSISREGDLKAHISLVKTGKTIEFFKADKYWIYVY